MRANIRNTVYLILLGLSAFSCGSPEDIPPVADETLPSDKPPVGDEQTVAEAIRFVGSLEDIETYDKHEPSATYTLTTVKNEFESFQAVVETVDGRPLDIEITTDTPSVEVRVSTLKFFEGVQDVLVPCKDFITPVDRKVKMWINVYVSEKTPAGEHQAKVILRNGFHRYEFGITVDVKDVMLPVKPLMPSVFGIERDLLVSSSNLSALAARRLEVAELLLEYRASPFFCKWMTGTVWTSSSPYDYGHPQFWESLKDERFSRIALPSKGLTDEELESMLTEAESNGMLDDAYFYVWDEPRCEAHYAELRDYAGRIHKYSPDAKVLTTFFGGSEDGPHKGDFYAVFDFLKGTTSIFCTSAWALHNSEAAADKCREKLAEGEEWWSYVCMGTVPGLSHNSSPAENRIVMWRTWKEQNTGFLYWAVNSYSSIYPMRSRPELPAGDGIVVYPGEPFGYDGICSSVRLERWRDGAEDCDMLMMVEASKGRKAALDILGKVYTSPSKYEKSQDKIFSFRDELIETLTAE